MNINAIKDAIQALAQSFQLASSFPSTVLVFLNAYLVLPLLGISLRFDTPDSVLAVAAFILLISYILYAFNFPLIRLLEGYKLRGSQISRALRERQLSEYDLLIRRIAARVTDRSIFKSSVGFDPDNPPVGCRLSEEQSARWERINQELADLSCRLDISFPGSPQKVLATGLGNVIRAFEDYSGSRYGMDSTALWPRLIPILRDTKFIEFVAQEKTVFDFLLNMLVVSAVVSLEMFYFALFAGRFVVAIVTVLVAPLVLFVLWEGLKVAARQWGETVRVAFDLHRLDLWTRLGLRPQATFDHERRLWIELSRFLMYRRKNVSFDGFVPLHERPQKEAQNAEKAGAQT